MSATEGEKSEPPRARFRFTTRQLFASVTCFSLGCGLLSASTRAFVGDLSAFGVAIGVGFLAAGIAVFCDRPVLSTLIVVVLFTLILTPCVGFLNSVRQAALNTRCYIHLTRISFALRNYEATHGSLPPAYIADDQGRPMHSWRVLILPEMGYNSLYRRYSFSEPWNGPNNRLLLDEMPEDYRCLNERNEGASTTNYVAVIGKDTMWPGSTPLKFSDCRDAHGGTILLLAIPGARINWMEPRDVSYDEVLAQSERDTSPNDRWGGAHGRLAGYCGCDRGDLPEDAPRELMIRLLTRDGGEPRALPQYSPKYGLEDVYN